MKYLIIISLVCLSVAGHAQNSKPGVKLDKDTTAQRLLDSLVNTAPHPDSAFISMSQVQTIVQLIEEQWNMKNGVPATEALRLLTNYAAEELKKKRRAKLQKN